MTDKIRVKCVDVGCCAYLTTGKVYAATEYGVGYGITDDNGDEANYFKTRFEVLPSVSEYPNPPHAHAECIKAWADGADIQWKGAGDTDWYRCTCPGWYLCNEYRTKPVIDEAAIAECERKIDAANEGIKIAVQLIHELREELKQLKGEDDG